MDYTQEELTPEQLKNAIALYMTLLEKFSPEMYELKKVIDIFLPYIGFGEIHAKFIVQKGKVVRVEAYPLISRKVEESEKS
jgi:hypothetical protein